MSACWFTESHANFKLGSNSRESHHQRGGVRGSAHGHEQMSRGGRREGEGGGFGNNRRGRGGEERMGVGEVVAWVIGGGLG
ncbi:hypothetical protein LIER_35161 [Lithospermum erythrorhizon]|uniref:Uncharacterized protein n=1 Tax=Lithospermum erythrorhizon TaxID=34254 RepID=A0AAV3NLG5_LITER